MQYMYHILIKADQNVFAKISRCYQLHLSNK